MRTAAVCLLGWTALHSSAWAYINAGFKSRAEEQAHYSRQKQEAVTAFMDRTNEAIRRNANDPVPHYQLGNFHYAERRFADARRSYHAAVQADPNFGRAYLHRAFAKWQQEETLPALADLELAVAKQPDLADAHFFLGLMFYACPHDSVRDLRKARAAVEQACALNSTTASCALAARICADLGDLSAAARWQSQAIRVAGAGHCSIPELRRTLKHFERGETSAVCPVFGPGQVESPVSYKRGSK